MKTHMNFKQKVKNAIASTFVFAAMTMSTCSVSAQTVEQKQQFCSQMSSIAQSIMQARQNGVVITDILQLNSQTAFKEIADHITYMAYKSQLMLSDRNKELAVREFGNSVFLDCAKSVGIEFN